MPILNLAQGVEFEKPAQCRACGQGELRAGEAVAVSGPLTPDAAPRP